MTPADLGFPAKFADWRRNQEALILDAAGSSRRFTLINAPTGAGKSATNIALHVLSGGRTLVLTRTKGLSDQLFVDFEPMGLVDMRGLSNYRCVAVDRGGELEEFGAPGSITTCADGPCRVGVECSLRKGGCHYYDAVRHASEQPIVSSNYAYWMAINRFAEPGTLGEFDLLVLDEAHAAPDLLAEFCAVEIDRADVRAFFDLRMPDATDDMGVWIEWAGAAYKAAQSRWREIRLELENTRGSGRRKLARQMRDVATLGAGLSEIAGAAKWRRTNASNVDVFVAGAQTDWIKQPTPTGVRFMPVWGHAYAERYLFQGIKRVVLSSATLHQSDARDLGIPANAYDWFEVPSTFAPARRRLTYVPTTNVDSKMNEGQTRIWLNRIDQIVGARLDRCGIIHTKSYERARLVMERSAHRAIMLSHTTGTTRDVVEIFKQHAHARQPRILVSPSMAEGYDFPDDECRYQILAKTPFTDGRDPIAAARKAADKTYLNRLAARELIQQVGRGTRSETDWCENFIIDDHIAWFWKAARRDKLFPQYFVDAFEQASAVPDPPSLDTGPTVVAGRADIVTMASGIKMRRR